jgi:hypothetical protein
MASAARKKGAEKEASCNERREKERTTNDKLCCFRIEHFRKLIGASGATARCRRRGRGGSRRGRV